MTLNIHEQAVHTLMAPAILRAPNDPEMDGTEYPPSQENIEAAKVWATMAVAHEQRTANLLALHGALRDRNEHRKAYGVLEVVNERLGLA